MIGFFEGKARIPPTWLQTPRFNSLQDLRALSKQKDLPDRTYDLDGDGAVGNLDVSPFYLAFSRFVLLFFSLRGRLARAQ